MTVLDELAELSWSLFRPRRPRGGLRGLRYRASLLWRESVRAIREAHRQGFKSDEELIQMASGRLFAVLSRHQGSGIGWVQLDADGVEALARLVVERFYQRDLGRLRQVEHKVADWLAFWSFQRLKKELQDKGESNLNNKE